MYKLLKIGTQANSQIREYIVDSVDDLSNLPNSDPFGSTAFVIATGETYMKNSSGTYVKIITDSGGGDSGGGSVDIFIVSGEVEYDDQQDTDLVTINKTTEEIYAAAESNKQVIMFINDDGDISQWILSECGEGKDDDIYADFVSLVEEEDCIVVKTLTFHSDSDGEEMTSVALSNKEDTTPYSVEALRSFNGNGKEVLTFSMTAQEGYDVAKNGKIFLTTFALGNGVTCEAALSIGAVKVDYNGTAQYMFRVDTDKVYLASNLSGSDPVVMTEV